MGKQKRPNLELIGMILGIHDRVSDHLGSFPDKHAAMKQVADAVATLTDTDENDTSFVEAADACERAASAFMFLAGSCYMAEKRMRRKRP